jgi:hypothetical protein
MICFCERHASHLVLVLALACLAIGSLAYAEGALAHVAHIAAPAINAIVGNIVAHELEGIS